MLRLYSTDNKVSLLRLFFFVFVFEVIIGGSGRIFELPGGITLRMLTFPIALLISAFLITWFQKINRDAAFIVIAYIVLIFLNAVTGFMNYGKDERVVENILYQSFLLLLPFYTFFIRNLSDIKVVSNIIKIASLGMAAAYLLLLYFILTGKIEFSTVYDYIEIRLT